MKIKLKNITAFFIKMSPLWLLLFTVFPLRSQQAMTLQECLQVGLENNYEIRMVRNEAHISDNNFTLGNAGYLPDIGLSSGFTVRNSGSRQVPSDETEAQHSSNDITQNMDVAANLQWTLFEGFKVQTNYRRLKELKQIGELNTRFAVENTIASITAEYYNLVQQQLRLKNLQFAVELSKERLRIVEARYQVGAGSRLDLQQAKVDFNADSSQLIQQYEAVHTSKIQLNELMGVDINSLLDVRDTEIKIDTTLFFPTLYEDTHAYNTSLMLSHKAKTVSELDLKSQQSRNYPYLRLNTGYGYTKNDYNTGNWSRQNNWGPHVGFSLGYTLFEGFNRSREQRNARIQIENKTLAVQKKELEVQSDFASMWMGYQNNMELTSLEEESLENAQLNYEIAMERYKIGDISGIQLREAQNGLLGAEERLLNAQYRTKLYEISLMQISGHIDRYIDSEE